jgi:hypothetical protein
MEVDPTPARDNGRSGRTAATVFVVHRGRRIVKKKKRKCVKCKRLRL